MLASSMPIPPGPVVVMYFPVPPPYLPDLVLRTEVVTDTRATAEGIEVAREVIASSDFVWDVMLSSPDHMCLANACCIMSRNDDTRRESERRKVYDNSFRDFSCCRSTCGTALDV